MKTIRTTLLAFAAIFVGLSSMNAQTDSIKHQIIQTEPFTEIVVEGNFTIFLSQGPVCKVALDADQSLTFVPIIKVEAKKNVLTIGLDKKLLKSSRLATGKMNVYVTVVDLNKLTISDACIVDMQTALNVKDLKIKATASAIKSMNMMAKSIDLTMKKSAKADFKGQIATFKGLIDGASAATITECSISKMNLDVTGASNLLLNGKISKCNLGIDASKVTATLNSDAVDASLKGSSSLMLDGNATTLSFSAKGGSTIDASKCPASNASVTLAGSSHASVSPRKSISGDLKGSSILTYTEHNEQKQIKSEGKFKFNL